MFDIFIEQNSWKEPINKLEWGLIMTNIESYFLPVSLVDIVNLWQSLLTSFSPNQLEWVMIKDSSKAYGKLYLKPNIHHIFWHRPWRLFEILANKTFWPSALVFSLFQSGLPEDYHGACLSVPKKWLSEYMKGFDNEAPA